MPNELLKPEMLTEAQLDELLELFISFLEGKSIDKLSFWDRFLWLFHKTKEGSLDDFFKNTTATHWLQVFINNLGDRDYEPAFSSTAILRHLSDKWKEQVLEYISNYEEDKNGNE